MVAVPYFLMVLLIFMHASTNENKNAGYNIIKKRETFVTYHHLVKELENRPDIMEGLIKMRNN